MVAYSKRFVINSSELVGADLDHSTSSCRACNCMVSSHSIESRDAIRPKIQCPIHATCGYIREDKR